MSGILKRKFEQVDVADPSPCLSLRGSEDDEVSCSDSGNSSDSLNPPAPSGPLVDSSLQGQRKRPRGRCVRFESVTVYYFNRRQGFTSVPTQGGSTLGMSPRHSWVRRFTLGEFAAEQERSHRDMLREHLKEEKLNAIKLKLTKNGTVSSVEAEALTMDDISEDDLDLDNTEVDEYFFLQPLTTRRRRALLRASGVRRIDVEEKHELRALRVSREECGCHCRGMCDPETCVCSLAGIKCQVDRMSFPCGCTKEGCSNASGRLEFNPIRVRTHFLHTIMKLELERSREQEVQPPPLPPQQQQQQQLVTNGNGCHGDILQVQQQQPNLQFPLMNATPHSPIMHLQNASEADLHVEEEEEEDEEDDDVDNDDDEDDDDDDDDAYEDDEDEDGSSLCSGLSDCSTHSLETSDTEEEEEEEEEGENSKEEDEGDWESAVDGVGPPPFSRTEVVPLSSALGFSNSRSTHVNLSHPITSHSSPSKDHYQMDDPPKGTLTLPLPLPSDKIHVDPSHTTIEPTLDSRTPSEPPYIEPHSQTEQQSSDRHFPNATESPVLPATTPSATQDGDIAPGGETGEQQLQTELEDNRNNNVTQTEALVGAGERLGEDVRQQATEGPGQLQVEQQEGSLGQNVVESTLPDEKRDPPCL